MIDRASRFSELARFDPQLSRLAEPARRVWPRLTELPIDAVLYGGTAIALRLAHRESEDFDLFLPRHFTPDELRRTSPLLRDAPSVQSAPDALTVRVDGIRVSLFGLDLASTSRTWWAER